MRSLRKKAGRLKREGRADPYIKGLIERYASDDNGYPLWAMLELIDFGSLCWLYTFVADRYDNDLMRQESYVLTVVRLLRNACAHGNCILNDVFGAEHAETRINNEVRQFVGSVKTIGSGQRGRMLNNQRVYSIVATLYAHRRMASETAHRTACESLARLINRMGEHKEYYLENNYALVHTYHFFEKLVSCSFNCGE